MKKIDKQKYSKMYYFTAALFYLAAIINMFQSGIPAGLSFTCIGSVFLCLGAVYKKKKQNDKSSTDTSKKKQIQNETDFLNCGKRDGGVGKGEKRG